MKMDKERYEKQTQYLKENFTRLAISYPNAYCEKVRAAVKESGQSMAAYFRQAIEERMARDGFVWVEDTKEEPRG